MRAGRSVGRWIAFIITFYVFSPGAAALRSSVVVGDAEVRLRVRHSLFSWQNQQLRAEKGVREEGVSTPKAESEQRAKPPPSLPSLPFPSLHISPITKPRRIPTTATPISPTASAAEAPKKRRWRRRNGGKAEAESRPNSTESLLGFPVNSTDFCMTNGRLLWSDSYGEKKEERTYLSECA